MRIFVIAPTGETFISTKRDIVRERNTFTNGDSYFQRLEDEAAVTEYLNQRWNSDTPTPSLP